jgi:uncharacterized protein
MMMLRNDTVCLGCQSGMARALFRTEPDRLEPMVAAKRVSRKGQYVTLQSEGDRIAGKLFLPQSPRKAPVVILCHGAGEWKENYFEMSEYLAEQGLGSFALDLRGHGESGGERFCVQMHQWVADIRAALDYLPTHPRVDGDRIAAFGFASGATAALETALVDRRLKAVVVLEAAVSNLLPFSLRILLKALLPLGRMRLRRAHKPLRVSLPWLRHRRLASDPVINRRILSNPFAMEAFESFPLPGAEEVFFAQTLNRVPLIQTPTIVVWGQDDCLAPPAVAQRLFDALTCKKAVQLVPGNGYVGHLDRNREKVFELTSGWVNQNLA